MNEHKIFTLDNVHETHVQNHLSNRRLLKDMKLKLLQTLSGGLIKTFLNFDLTKLWCT